MRGHSVKGHGAIVLFDERLGVIRSQLGDDPPAVAPTNRPLVGMLDPHNGDLFAPRFLDTHPEAVKIPWVHDNVEADEVLFYVRGNFGSRRGIEPASITLHPRGIPHGPHPGTIMASKNATRTEELAVMFDTQHTLELTEEALKLDDEKYPLSWLD